MCFENILNKNNPYQLGEPQIILSVLLQTEYMIDGNTRDFITLQA